MDNDNKLAALTNEPIKVQLAGEEFSLRRPTIKDYKKIRGYLREREALQENSKMSDDDAVDFGVFFIATLLVHPEYTAEQLEDKLLISDLEKLTDIMEQLGFKKPQDKSTDVPVVQEVPVTTVTNQ